MPADLDVLRALDPATPQTSAEVAAQIGLTPFQITARLASMEKRGMSVRRDGMWLRAMDVEIAEGMAAKAPPRTLTISVNTSQIIAARDDEAPVVIDTIGWRIAQYWWCGLIGREDEQIPIFVDPMGTLWVEAEPSESATLLIDHRTRGFGVRRMVVFDGNSATYRRIERRGAPQYEILTRNYPTRDESRKRRTQRDQRR